MDGFIRWIKNNRVFAMIFAVIIVLAISAVVVFIAMNQDKLGIKGIENFIDSVPRP